MSAPEKPGAIAATAGVWITFQRRTYQVYGYLPHLYQSAVSHFHRDGAQPNPPDPENAPESRNGESGMTMARSFPLGIPTEPTDVQGTGCFQKPFECRQE